MGYAYKGQSLLRRRMLESIYTTLRFGVTNDLIGSQWISCANELGEGESVSKSKVTVKSGFLAF